MPCRNDPAGWTGGPTSGPRPSGRRTTPGSRGRLRPIAPRRVCADLVDALAEQLDDTDLGREQLVHRDLAGNVLLDATGVPFVIDFSPAWRSPLWAEAICVLDAVLWRGAPPDALDGWRAGAERQAMLRAALFRVLSDQPCDVARYAALGLV